ncbi:lanthionine synthetase C family protein [Kitasatospora sp. NPDC051170]|uniref:lanthionine synthetase C family protein n=1 Tax=Kitasatospora sp. NPDC051170 TaxID=3364056 RepID=UPI0037A6EF15
MSNLRSLTTPPDLSAVAHERAVLVGERLSQEALVAASVERAAAEARNPFEWGGASLGKGYTGVALLQLALARHPLGAQDDWLARAQGVLGGAVASTHTHPLTTTSLLLGSSGLALAVEEFRRYDERYAPSARRLWQQVAEQVRGHNWPPRERGYAATDYDVISGAAGVLGALVSAPEALAEHPEAVDLLVRYLLEAVGGPEADLACRVPPELFPLEEYREQYPFGYYNTGLSHGIPGILSALAAAHRAGCETPGIRAALGRLAQRLLDWSTSDGFGPDWPAGIPLTEGGAADPAAAVPTRTAWCYGTPGVAVALFQAGTALGDGTLRSAAADAHRAAVARALDAPGALSSPTLCHGTAGLLCTAAFFAEQTEQNDGGPGDGGRDDDGRDDVHRLTERLLTQCDPEHPLVVRDEESTGNFVDDPSFLTGAAGVGLALLTAAGGGRQLWWNGLMLHG